MVNSNVGGGGAGQMNGNMMQQSVSPGQMLGMEQQLQQQQLMQQQQQQATYDVLDNAGYCSPSNGELLFAITHQEDHLLIHLHFFLLYSPTIASHVSNVAE